MKATVQQATVQHGATPVNEAANGHIEIGTTPRALRSRHLLGIDGLEADEITLILDTAEAMKEIGTRAIKKVPTLRGRTVVNLFFEPSTRTRTSFEIAEKRLSADTLSIATAMSSVTKGESLLDTIRNIEAMSPDMIVMRHSSSGAPHLLARMCQSTIVNAGDGTHEHPTQALLDAATLRDRLGNIAGRRIGIVGAVLHSRVARSNVFLLATLGAEVVVIAPPTLLPTGLDEWPCRVNPSLDAELPACDAVMMLRVQAERMHGSFFPSAREYAVSYGLSERRAAQLPDHAVVLHPGPMVRGMEIAPAVADSPASAVLAQVANGVHVRMAVLYHLLAGAPE